MYKILVQQKDVKDIFFYDTDCVPRVGEIIFGMQLNYKVTKVIHSLTSAGIGNFKENVISIVVEPNKD